MNIISDLSRGVPQSIIEILCGVLSKPWMAQRLKLKGTRSQATSCDMKPNNVRFLKDRRCVRLSLIEYAQTEHCVPKSHTLHDGKRVSGHPGVSFFAVMTSDVVKFDLHADVMHGGK